MRRTSDSTATASATITGLMGASESSSSVATPLRKVRLSDRELLQRVQRVAAPTGPVDLQGLETQPSWKQVRGASRGMKMYVRELTTSPPFPTQRCQVVVGGEIRAQVSTLLSLLRAPTENESNSLLHALYGSRFIYSSLVHASTHSERGSLLTPEVSTTPVGQQVMVRTASFVHSGRFNPFKHRSSIPVVASNSMTRSDSHSSIQDNDNPGVKNEQMCYVELLTPTQEGFRIVFCSLDAADVTAGKAPPERVVELHPFSGWITVEPTPNDPETLRFTYQAAFLGHTDGNCDFHVAQDRLLFLGKGICKLEKVLRQQQRRVQQPHTTTGRVWRSILKPFRGLSSSEEQIAGGSHHNWNCIACTRSFLPTLRKRWRRCDLCAYRVCAEPPCCTHERVAIYHRYVAPLLVCARCRECIDERDSEHRENNNRARGGNRDVRYAGLSLQFTDQMSEFQRDVELDRSRNRFRPSIVSYRSRERQLMKRRTQSDPPPMLPREFSSSDSTLSPNDRAYQARF
ncbi:hypothetical protein PHMEG_00011688 [Phytophthora megakarya]|uniref:FYVE-type domain-containing protein n=1 Tax=Phytophthora megakarya TaxID=4795 RepID=A0A225WBK9_9STRA|nr:hypothetical protein PHMEG_00011688 [Phytophthora megakarya]